METISARVPILKKDLDEKILDIGKLKSFLYAMKSGVSTFFSDSLPRGKEQYAEVVLFTTHRDNVDRCLNIIFISTDKSGVDYKKNCDILQGYISNDYSEVIGEVVIDVAKTLDFDDISMNDNDEG